MFVKQLLVNFVIFCVAFAVLAVLGSVVGVL